MPMGGDKGETGAWGYPAADRDHHPRANRSSSPSWDMTRLNRTGRCEACGYVRQLQWSIDLRGKGVEFAVGSTCAKKICAALRLVHCDPDDEERLVLLLNEANAAMAM